MHDLYILAGYKEYQLNRSLLLSYRYIKKKKGVSQRELGLFIFETPVTNITITWFVKDWV